MRVKGMNEQQVIDIVERLSRDLYDGNIVIRESHDRSTSVTRHATFTIRTRDSRGPGSRRSWSGRRLPAACWHAHWHLMDYIFTAYPEAVVRTAMATYTADTWRDRAEDTRETNIGSQFAPAYMPELCECDDDVDAADRVAIMSAQMAHYATAVNAIRAEELASLGIVALRPEIPERPWDGGDWLLTAVGHYYPA